MLGDSTYSQRCFELANMSKIHILNQAKKGLTQSSRFNYTCTLGHLVNPDNQTVQLHAYNWTCDQIGYSPAVEIGKPFNFNSNLSSVVVINFNDSAYPPSFMYAGKKYGQNATGTMLPNATCYNSGGQYACETQFDCGKEVNMADVNGGKTWRESAIATEEITLDEDDRRLADGEGMKEL
jgi:hypothetical protein